MTAFFVAVVAVAAVVIGAVGVAAVFDAAGRPGGYPASDPRVEARRWRPPFVRGPALWAWARASARRTVRQVLASGVDEDTPSRLMDELDRGLGLAMVYGSPAAAADMPTPCPDEGQGIIGITAPEALELARYFRTHLSPRDLARLREESAQNVGWIQRISSVYGSAAPCALQGGNCVCAAWSSRPLRCRAVHAVAQARRYDAADPWLDDGAPGHTQAVCDGARVGLAEGLREAGLDGRAYEMHSALVRALEVPDASRRWARGEPVFAGCMPWMPAHVDGEARFH